MRRKFVHTCRRDFNTGILTSFSTSAPVALSTRQRWLLIAREHITCASLGLYYCLYYPPFSFTVAVSWPFFLISWFLIHFHNCECLWSSSSKNKYAVIPVQFKFENKDRQRYLHWKVNVLRIENLRIERPKKPPNNQRPLSFQLFFFLGKLAFEQSLIKIVNQFLNQLMLRHTNVKISTI